VKDILSVERGCLLFRDETSGVLLPWAVSGLDTTSARRLRIPEAALLSRAPGPVDVLRGSLLREFRIFLSHRDFRSARSMRVLALPLGQADAAYLVSLDRRDFLVDEAVPRDWNDVRALLGERLSIFRAKFRASPLPGDDAASASDRALEMKERIAAAAADAKSKGMSSLFVAVPFGALIDSVCSGAPDADPYRIFSETMSAISRIVPSPGLVLSLPRFRAGILFCTSSKPDAELFLAQLGSSLSRILSRSGGLRLSAEASFDPSSGGSCMESLFRLERQGEVPAK
jgi:hypothetical protein